MTGYERELVFIRGFLAGLVTAYMIYRESPRLMPWIMGRER